MQNRKPGQSPRLWHGLVGCTGAGRFASPDVETGRGRGMGTVLAPRTSSRAAGGPVEACAGPFHDSCSRAIAHKLARWSTLGFCQSIGQPHQSRRLSGLARACKPKAGPKAVGLSAHGPAYFRLVPAWLWPSGRAGTSLGLPRHCRLLDTKALRYRNGTDKLSPVRLLTSKVRSDQKEYECCPTFATANP